MNDLQQIGIIVEELPRPFFNESDYRVEWFLENSTSFSTYGVAIVKRYVNILKKYKHANRIIR